MSWSLAIANGDLSIGSSGMNVVTSSVKLGQDLRCAILEPMGTDDMHPSYGSLIDGGTLPDGTYQPGVIGSGNDAVSASFVGAEVQRICTNYQEMQVVRQQNDVATYGQGTLVIGEALLGIENMTITQVEVNMLVAVLLQTGTGSQLLNIPLST